MIKVAVDTGPLIEGDIGRGIGFHTEAVISYLRKNKDLDVDTVNFKTADLTKYDILHYPKFNPYTSKLPLLKRAKTVITIHDLIYLIYPKAYPPGIKGRLRYILNKIFLLQVDAIITISETSKKDIVRFLKVNPEKVYVIYLAARDMYKKIEDKNVLDNVRLKYKLPERFVLFIGSMNYNKNVMNLAIACEKLRIPLVIAGKPPVEGLGDKVHPEVVPYKELIDKYCNDKNVIFLGFVSDLDLVAITNLASVYCQPSLYEGFGLPILEAFAVHTPVVASNIQTHREIAGDAVLYAMPEKSADIAEKIKSFLNSPSLRKQYVTRGLTQLKKYSWEKCAKETSNVYDLINQKKIIEAKKDIG